jgi:hypothetical protein
LRGVALIVALVLEGCGSCNGEVASGRADASASDSGKVDAAKTDGAILEAAAPVDIGDLPDGGLADLELRAKHLLEAIAQNEPSLAADIVLPRDAYVAARDAQDPGGIYDSKFKTAFATQVGRVHHHEKGIENAVFVSFDLGNNASRVSPRKHEWNEPLWHATRSTLTFTIEGRVHRIEVAEMIAWHGNWYVSKLR